MTLLRNENVKIVKCKCEMKDRIMRIEIGISAYTDGICKKCLGLKKILVDKKTGKQVF